MDELIAQLKALLGEVGVLTGADAQAKAQGIWLSMGTPAAVIRPATTAEVSAVLKLCHAAEIAIVPWGGKSGLVEGARADGLPALSLERMTRVEAIDPVTGTMTVEAGLPLQAACEAAEKEGMFFPLDLGARGSATIGGNISTNAGGNRVIRYGMMRDMVLGLEAVLADGTVISAMNQMIKNNAGYDLKQLFIGTEGTLGVVTRAVLRLRPAPRSQNTAFAAIDSLDGVARFLRHMEAVLGGTLSAFEVMWDDFYTLVTKPPAAGRPPLAYGHPYYVLVESLGGDQDEDAARFERALSAALEAGQIADAVVAKNQSERAAMWGLRDDVGQIFQNAPIFTFDVSLRISDMESYVATVKRDLTAKWPDHTLMLVAHLGDGNLHPVVGVGDDSPEARRAVEQIIYRPLKACGGSISAEHGIGLEKRPYLGLSRSPEEIALMRTLKQALDPKNILNPGKVVDMAPVAQAAE